MQDSTNVIARSGTTKQSHHLEIASLTARNDMPGIIFNCLSASLMLSVNSLFLLALHELLKIAESDGRTACLYELRAYD